MDHSGKLMRQLDNSDSEESSGFSLYGMFQFIGSTVNNVVTSAKSLTSNARHYITGTKRTFDDFINEPASSSDSNDHSSIEEEGQEILDTTPVLESPHKKRKVAQDDEHAPEDIQHPNIVICNGPAIINHPVFDDINDIGMEEEHQPAPQNNEIDEEPDYDFGVNQEPTFLPKRAATTAEARRKHLANRYNVNGMRSNLYKRR